MKEKLPFPAPLHAPPAEIKVRRQEFRAAERQLQSFNFLPNLGKAEILLVFAGSKPAALLYPRWEEGVANYTETQFMNDIESLKGALNLLKLPFNLEIMEDSRKDPPKKGKVALVMVGHTAKDVGRLVTAFVGPDDPVRKRAVGNALGYPMTAVEAYANGESFGMDELPETVKNSPAFKFLSFGRLSRDRWKDELAVADQWARKVKEISPDIYRQVIQS